MESRVKEGLSNITSAALVEKGRTIVQKMTGNPVYTDIQDLLPPLTAACDALDAANQAAAFNRGKLEHEQKREAFVTLMGLIRALAPQVQTLSGGDPVKILGGGFDVIKRASKPEVPGECVRFENLYTPFEGTAKLRWKNPHNTRFVRVELQDEKGWQLLATTTRSDIVLTGLESGQHYTLRVIAVGAAGNGPSSDVLIVKAA